MAILQTNKNNDETIGICYCSACEKAGGNITFKDDKNKTVFIRSGMWLRDKLRQELYKEEV